MFMWALAETGNVSVCLNIYGRAQHKEAIKGAEMNRGGLQCFWGVFYVISYMNSS